MMSDEQPTQEAARGIAPEVIERAKETGWTPLDEFKGDPAKWKDADEWVERGEKLIPVQKADNERLRREIRELKQVVAEFAKHHENVSQREFQRALQTIQAAQAQAVTDGDGKKWEELEKMKGQLQVPATPGAQMAREAAIPPTLVEWQERNPWYGHDPAMTGACDRIAAEYNKRGYTGEALLEKIDNEIVKAFPNKFRNNAQAATPPVEGGTQPVSSGGGKHSYNTMPKEAREACDRFVKQGLIKSRDQYVKDYYGL